MGTLKWNKLGKICDTSSLGLSWYKKNLMTPVPYILDDDTIRVFVTLCDEKNRGRMGYVDVKMDDPTVIVDYSKEPILDLGGRGRFDEDGVLTSAILVENDSIYMYYTSFQLQRNVPYYILSGLAVSNDKGRSFTRMSETPLLERRDGELFQRSAIDIMKIDDTYRIWYTSGEGWFNLSEDKEEPVYNLKTIVSDSFDSFTGDPEVSIDLEGDEYGFTSPQVWKDGDKYKMIYSIRSISKGYRLGYCESDDGIHFKRMDNIMDIEVSKEGFDSEMICYAKFIQTRCGTYLFYCGNHYGQGGMGVAILEGEL